MLSSLAFLSLDSFGLAAGVALLLMLALVAALWVDKRYGEPPLRFHPVVWMGHYLKFCGSVATRLPPAAAFAMGALAWWFGVIAVGLVDMLLQVAVMKLLQGFFAAPALGSGVELLMLLAAFSWLLKTTLSWRMLKNETIAVELALQQSLQAGRKRLSWLVSRGTTALSESEVRESAIESLSENLNDSVIAPIFWFVLLGLPGAAIYRFANTADAMWGYRELRSGVDWEWAGKWAARADDVLSWLPARITALLFARVAGGLQLSVVAAEARKTPSPNSGWPMAAMALALGVSLRKPGVYVLNEPGRAPGPGDTAKALEYASKVLVAAVSCALIAIILIAMIIFSLP